MKMLEEIKEEPYLNTTCLDTLQVVGEYPESGQDIILVKNEIDEVYLEGSPEEVIISKPLDNDIKDMFCHTCYKEISYKEISHHILANHQIKSSNCDELLRCSECNYTSYSKYHMERHCCNSHIPAIFYKRKIFRCDKCTYTTTISRRFKRHIVKHNEKIYLTKVDFSEKAISRINVNSANTNRPLSCQKCNFNTDLVEILVTHMKESCERMFFKCIPCGKLLKVKYKQYHMAEHAKYSVLDQKPTEIANKRPLLKNLSTLCKKPSNLSNSVKRSNPNKYIQDNMPQITQSRLNTPIPYKDKRPNFIVNNITVNNFNAVPATTVLSSPNVSNLQTNPVVNFQTTNVYESNNTNPIILYNGIPLVNNPQVGQGFVPLPSHFLNQNFFVVNAESSSVQQLPITPQTNLNFQQYPGNYMFLQTPNQVNVQSLPVLQVPNLPNQIETINNQTQTSDDVSWPVRVENVIPDCVVGEAQDKRYNLHSDNVQSTSTACDTIIARQNDKLPTIINNTTLRQILPKPESIYNRPVW